MRSCFIPLCDSYHKTEKKRRFFLPSSKRLPRWQEILSKHHTKSFKGSNKLCEFHFNPEDIESKFSTVIKGQVVEFDRERPKLKDNAVPVRNLVYEQKKEKESVKVVNVFDKSGDQEECQEKPKLKKVKVVPDSKKLQQQKSQFPEVVKDTPSIEEVPQTPVTEENVSNEFLNIYEEIYEVVLPSTLWAVFRCPKKEFISFAYMNPSNRKVVKQTVLLKSGKYTVTLYEEVVREMQLTADKITCEFLSNDIEEIDAI